MSLFVLPPARRCAGILAALVLGAGLAALFLASLASPAAARRGSLYINVSVDTPVDINDAAHQQCTSAPDDCSLRGAVSLANANAPSPYRIFLPAGSITLTLSGANENKNASGDLDITANARILIVGNAAGSVVQAGTNTADGIDRVFHVRYFGELTLQDLTVRYGRADQDGGGILNEGALTLERVHLTANTALGGGGGLAVARGTVILSGTQVLSNTALTGGGLAVQSGSIVITASQLLSNTAGGIGGALYLGPGASLKMTGSRADGNQAATAGGGLLIDAGAATLTDVHIGGNRANFGGGIRLRQSAAALTYTRGTVEHNTALFDGGGIYLSHGNSYLEGVLIAHNSAQALGNGRGGGGHIPSGTALLSGTQILSNTALRGGGLSTGNANNAPVAVTLVNSSLTGNEASAYGGGLYVIHQQTVLSRTSLLSNTAGIGGAAVADGDAALSISGGCIVYNSDTAVVSLNGVPIAAARNWWGAADGPAGNGPGNGDSVSGNVEYTGFAAAPPGGCPSRRLPLADAGAPQTAAPGDAVTLDGSASRDPEGGPLTYRWRQTGGVSVTLSSPTAVSPTFTAPGLPGALTFTLAVTGASLRRATDATAVYVVVNQPPAADAGAPQTALPGSLVTLDGSASRDPEGGPLTYRWRQTGGVSVTLSSPAAVSPTFTAPGLPGVLTFTLTVTDTGGLSGSAAATVRVSTWRLYLPLILRP